MKRFLCLYFPRWPLQSLQQDRPETRGEAVALYKRTAHGPRLIFCSPEAGKLGVRRGMPMADARALAPELQTFEFDERAAQEALENLALWAGRFSPLAGIEARCAAIEYPQSLLLESTGCEQVFGGEENLIRQAVQGLKKRNFNVRAGAAVTLGAAWALAHFGNAPPLAPPMKGEELEVKDAVRALLAPLPLNALRLDHEVVVFMKNLGLHSIGDLLKQPRASLPSRFGPELIERLDQALGDAPEMIPLIRPAPEIYAARAFEYPIRNLEIVTHILDQLAARVAAELKARNQGARQIEAWLYHEAADPLCVGVSLFKSSASRKHLMQLLRTRLEGMFSGFGSPGSGPGNKSLQRYWNAQKNRTRAQQPETSNAEPEFEAAEGLCACALHVCSAEALSEEQNGLFESTKTAWIPSGSLAPTLDRIMTRLSSAAVLRVALRADARPEDAYSATEWKDPGTENGSAVSAQRPRPLILYPAPLPIAIEWPDLSPLPHAFEYAGRRIGICAASGPERIESGWWKEEYTRRDYYAVDSCGGESYWIFRKLDGGEWFLHGMFE